MSLKIMFLAAHQGDQDKIEQLLAAGQSVFQRDEEGYNALDYAYDAEQKDLVDWLRNEMHNPELQVTQTKRYRLIQDGVLAGGTKQRVLVEYLASRTAQEFVYAGPGTGYAQVALARVAGLVGKRAVVVVGIFGDGPTELTQLAAAAGAQIIQLKQANLKSVQAAAEVYVKKNPRAELLPFGLDHPYLINLLAVNISSAVPPALRLAPPDRLWLVVGSGVILRALAQVWPATTFLCVRVGMKIWPDILEEIPHYQTFDNEAKEPAIPFWEPAQKLPPYPSIATYDAKLWSYFLEFGRPTDYIWNVASE